MQLDLFNDHPTDKLTVSDGLDLLWAYHLKGKPSARSYMANRKAICRSFGHKYLEDVTFLDVENHKRERPRGAAFHDHGCLSLLFNTLARWKREGLKANGIDFRAVRLPHEIPTAGVRRGAPGTRSRVITPREFASLTEHAPQFLLDIMVIRLLTGLRETDIKRLKPSHLNPYNNEIELEQSKTKRRISIPAVKKVREIFYRAREAEKTFVCDFTGIEYWWKRARRLAKIPDAQRRDLRRSGPSWAYDQFPDFEVMGTLLGHADPRSTQRYVVIKRKHVRKVVRHIEREYA